MTQSQSMANLVIITGMSGAGKTIAVQMPGGSRVFLRR